MIGRLDCPAFKECNQVAQKRVTTERVYVKTITSRCDQINIEVPNLNLTGNFICQGDGYLNTIIPPPTGPQAQTILEIRGSTRICDPHRLHVDTIDSCSGDPSPVQFVTDVAFGVDSQNVPGQPTVPLGNLILLNSAARHTEMTASMARLTQGFFGTIPIDGLAPQFLPNNLATPSFSVDNIGRQIIPPNVWTPIRFSLPGASYAGAVQNWANNRTTTSEPWPFPVMYYDVTMGTNNDQILQDITDRTQPFGPAFENGLLINRPNQGSLFPTYAHIKLLVDWEANANDANATIGTRALRYCLYDDSTNCQFGPTTSVDASTFTRTQTGTISSSLQQLITIEDWFGTGSGFGDPSKLAIGFEAYQSSPGNLAISRDQPAVLYFNWWS